MASLFGCAQQRSATATAAPIPAPPIAAGAHSVPAGAPGNFPEKLIDSLGTLPAEDDSALVVVRSILKVLFKGDATQRARQQAVDLVGGVVVGGFRLTDTDGDYYVRIPGPSYSDIGAAIRKLDALPQVVGAFPMFVGVKICCGEVTGRRSIR